MRKYPVYLALCFETQRGFDDQRLEQTSGWWARALMGEPDVFSWLQPAGPTSRPRAPRPRAAQQSGETGWLV
jgi:hypothetical protein